MAYHQPFQITGFHSCDKSVGLSILNGKKKILPSNNDWDWLGGGAYFWEQNPNRALEYAESVANKKQKNNGEIKTPFVIGAIIELGNCLNLIEPSALEILRQSHKSLQETYDILGDPMPVNKGPNRALDCAVIRFLHESNKVQNITPYDTIRCAFPEGNPIYQGSSFYDKLHIEICVINLDMIKGYFLPFPIEERNPHLKPDELEIKFDI